MSNSGREKIVPARRVPVPGGLSDVAADAAAAPFVAAKEYPSPTDLRGWGEYVSAVADATRPFLASLGQGITATTSEMNIGGVRVFEAIPKDFDSSDPNVVLEFHGGGFIGGGGDQCRIMAAMTADRTGRRIWSVDYRMPPADPYPAALDDGLVVYRRMLEQFGAERTAVYGGSAGGNIAAAVILRARDEGLPMPQAAMLITPEIDLTESGDSFATLLGLDTVLTGSLMAANLLYAGGADLRHPYLSPLFADFARGFPPTYLQSGTRDLFLSNTVRFHRALRMAGIEAADLHVWDAATHAHFPPGPESDDRNQEMRRFLAKWLRPA